jgi:hypothetical protein
VCSWRDGGSVRRQEFGMGRGGVVSGERSVVGGDRMEGGSEGRGCGEWVWDGRTWECGGGACVCVIRRMQAVELSGPHGKITSCARAHTHTHTNTLPQKRARFSDYFNAVPTEVIRCYVSSYCPILLQHLFSRR